MRPNQTVVLFTNSIAMGGMEAHLSMLAAGLRRQGAPVVALVPDHPSIAALRENLAGSGVEVRVLTSRRSALRLPGRLSGLARELGRHRPFVFHLHNTGSDGGLLPVVAAHVAGARAVLRTEHLPPLPPVSMRQRLFVRLRDMLTNRVICVSEEAREQHINVYGRSPTKLVSVPNGIDVAAYRDAADLRVAARRALAVDEHEIVIGAMGRMAEERKGFDVFIEMAALVAAARPDARFVLVGDGPLRTSLERLAERHGMADRVRFTGALDNRTVLPGIDIFVSPSLSDGGPITVLEAMASGVPVVSTNIGIAREAIEDGVSGRLVAVRDARALADAVLALCADEYARSAMGVRGRAAATDRFTIDRMVERVAAEYAGVSGDDRRHRRAGAELPRAN